MLQFYCYTNANPGRTRETTSTNPAQAPRIHIYLVCSFYLFVCKFCQSLLPALKMTLDGWKHVSNTHLQSKSLQSLVLCHNDTS